MTHKLIIKAKIRRSQGYYTVSIPELGIADYGKTKKELVKNTQAAVSLALQGMIVSSNPKQRKMASKLVSETIMERRIPARDIKPLTRTVSNILTHVFL